MTGVNEAMALHTADSMAADGASTFRRRLIVPFLRAGAATIACDHVPMSRDPNRRDAYGSVHKGNTLDGARIALENVELCTNSSATSIDGSGPPRSRAAREEPALPQ
jgi:hypothetical protein